MYGREGPLGNMSDELRARLKVRPSLARPLPRTLAHRVSRTPSRSRMVCA